MKVSIGVPLVMKGLDPGLFPEWARRSEAAGFASLGTLGRVVFDSHEELLVHTFMAAVTSRIRLATTVMIGPTRESTLLARQAATLDNLSGGRFTLGLGTGWREEDYVAVGADYARRGALLEEMVISLRRIWNGETIPVKRPEDRRPFVDKSATEYLTSHDSDMVGPIGPRVRRPGGPDLMLGGTEAPALRRVGRYADAYMTGPVPAFTPIPGSPDTVVSLYNKVRDYASSYDRPTPRLVHGTYAALEATDEEVAARLRDYYGIGGEDRYKWPFSRVLRNRDDIRHHLEEMEAAGVDECYLWPTIPEFKQIDLIAAAVF